MWAAPEGGQGACVHHFIPFIITCVVAVFCSSITKSFKNPFLADRPSCQFVAARARLLFSVAHALARSSDPAHRTKHMFLILHAANIALTSEDRSCFRSSTASSPTSNICASAVITSIISSEHFDVTGVPTATAINADVVAALDIVHKPHRRLQLPGG